MVWWKRDCDFGKRADRKNMCLTEKKEESHTCAYIEFWNPMDL